MGVSKSGLVGLDLNWNTEVTKHKTIPKVSNLTFIFGRGCISSSSRRKLVKRTRLRRILVVRQNCRSVGNEYKVNICITCSWHFSVNRYSFHTYVRNWRSRFEVICKWFTCLQTDRDGQSLNSMINNLYLKMRDHSA